MATAIDYGDVPLDPVAQAALLALRDAGGAAIVPELRADAGVTADEQIAARIEDDLGPAGLVEPVGTRRVAEGEPAVTVFGLTGAGQEFVADHADALRSNAAEVAASGGGDDVAAEVDRLSSEVERLSGSIDRIGSRLSGFENALSAAQDDFEGMQETLRNHRSAIESLGDRIEETNERIEAVSGELDRVEDRIDDTRHDALEEVKDAIDRHEDYLDGELAKLEQRVERLEDRGEDEGLF